MKYRKEYYTSLIRDGVESAAVYIVLGILSILAITGAVTGIVTFLWLTNYMVRSL